MRTHEITRQVHAPGFEGKYLSLTSYRADGSGVATPVWFVEVDGRLLVDTGGDSYKVTRIRRDPRVTVALCSARGRVHSPSVDASARVLDRDQVGGVKELLARKYRLDLLLLRPIRAIQSAFHRGPRPGSEVIVEITPDRMFAR